MADLDNHPDISALADALSHTVAALEAALDNQGLAEADEVIQATERLGEPIAWALMTLATQVVRIRTDSAIHGLAAFLASRDDTRAETVGRLGRAVELILTADVLPGDSAKHLVLYGLASQTGATRARGFDPAWKPAAAH